MSINMAAPSTRRAAYLSLFIMNLSISLQDSLLVIRHIEPQRAAGVHDIVRVEVTFERTEHLHLVTANLPFEPWRGHLADTVVVAH